MVVPKKKSKPLTNEITRDPIIGNELPLTAPGPSSPMTRLYANEDSLSWQ